MDVNLDDLAQLNEIKFKFSLVEIKKKFGVNRAALYGRMKYLQITTWKEPNGKVYLDAEQMRCMEELDAHMKGNNGRMEGFPVPPPSGPQTSITTTTTTEISPTDKSSESTQRLHPQNVIDLQGIHDAGMSKAIGIMLAENAIAHEYLNNPNLLPDEWKQKLAQASKIPEIDPFVFAASLKISVPFKAASSNP